MFRITRPVAAFAIIVTGTAIGIAGTDLVLPAIPALPAALGGSIEEAQLVLAAFTAGAAAGLLLFGELGSRFDQRRLLLLSLLSYGAVSLLCAQSVSIPMLIALRFAQGAAGAAAAVFAPGMIRQLFGEEGAVRALGALGSIEALTPALAPLLGAWLLTIWGWRASFEAIAGLAMVLAAVVAWRGDILPRVTRPPAEGGYLPLLRNGRFVGHALGYAFTLGGLLIFVFGAPAVFTHSLGLTLTAFVALQICGIIVFVITANLTGSFVGRYGASRVIGIGTVMSATGATLMLGYALAFEPELRMIIPIFTILNAGLGLRGAPGFHAAIVAAGGDDARGSALVVLSILLVTAGGTAAVAPFISQGLVAIAAGAAIATAGALLFTSAVANRSA